MNGRRDNSTTSRDLDWGQLPVFFRGLPERGLPTVKNVRERRTISEPGYSPEGGEKDEEPGAQEIHRRCPDSRLDSRRGGLAVPGPPARGDHLSLPRRPYSVSAGRYRWYLCGCGGAGTWQQNVGGGPKSGA